MRCLSTAQVNKSPNMSPHDGEPLDKKWRLQLVHDISLHLRGATAARSVTITTTEPHVQPAPTNIRDTLASSAHRTLRAAPEPEPEVHTMQHFHSMHRARVCVVDACAAQRASHVHAVQPRPEPRAAPEPQPKPEVRLPDSTIRPLSVHAT